MISRINFDVGRACGRIELTAAGACDAAGDVDVTTFGIDVIDDDAIVNRVVPGRHIAGIGPVAAFVCTFGTEQILLTHGIDRSRSACGQPISANLIDAALILRARDVNAPLGIAALYQAVDIDIVGIDEDIAACDDFTASKMRCIRAVRSAFVGLSDFILIEILDAAADIENPLRVGLHHAAGGLESEIRGRRNPFSQHHDVARARHGKRPCVIADDTGHDNGVVGFDVFDCSRLLVNDIDHAAVGRRDRNTGIFG